MLAGFTQNPQFLILFIRRTLTRIGVLMTLGLEGVMEATLAVLILTVARIVIPAGVILLIGSLVHKQLEALGGD